MASRELEKLLGEATFVFRGTVEKLEAATFADVPISDETAVVRVDSVLDAPEILGDQSGQAITVLLSKQGLAEGESAVFFTSSWLFGDGVAVREVGRRKEAKSGRLRAELQEVSNSRDEAALRERVNNADLVVVGKVAELKSAVGTKSRRMTLSEHDPQWWIATLEVDQAIKGRAPGRRIPVAFPTSRDVMWYRHPKPKPGQVGVWLLRKGEDLPDLPARAYTALDYQQPHRADLVAKVAKQKG